MIYEDLELYDMFLWESDCTTVDVKVKLKNHYFYINSTNTHAAALIEDREHVVIKLGKYNLPSISDDPSFQELVEEKINESHRNK